MKASWYAVKNVTPEFAEISIYDEIGSFGVSAKSFIAQLKGLGDRRVTLRIHSPGGAILEGNAIYNALKRHPGGVDVAIDGFAASMATVIAMVGEKRTMSENGFFVIHNPFGGIMGESKDMRKQADLLDSMKENLISAYEGKTGLGRKEISSMMDEETWLSAKEARELGFITDITEPFDMAASLTFNLGRFDKSEQVMAATKFSAFLEAQAKALGIEIKDGDSLEESAITEAIKALIPLKADLASAKSKITELEVAGSTKDSEITGFTNKISEHVNTINALTIERDDFKNKLASTESNLKTITEQRDNLKKAHGLAPAEVVPVVPEGGGSGPSDVYAKWLSLKGSEASEFYNNHKDVLTKFINKPAPTAA